MRETYIAGSKSSKSQISKKSGKSLFAYYELHFVCGGMRGLHVVQDLSSFSLVVCVFLNVGSHWYKSSIGIVSIS